MTAPRIRSIDATREVDATEAAAVGASGALTTRTWCARRGPASRDPVNSDRLVPLDVHLIQRRAQDRVHFAGDQDEVTSRRGAGRPRRLDIDRGGHAHRGRYFQTVDTHGPPARDADLVHATVDTPVCPDDQRDLGRIQTEGGC